MTESKRVVLIGGPAHLTEMEIPYSQRLLELPVLSPTSAVRLSNEPTTFHEGSMGIATYLVYSLPSTVPDSRWPQPPRWVGVYDGVRGVL